jgi:negative regulator of flagellin synthesis FlgM
MSFASGVGSVQKAAESIASAETQPVLQISSSDSFVGESKVTNSNLEHNDQTSLTPMADLISRSLENSDTRTAKVSSLQQAISGGNYNVSSSDVADKVISSLLE